MVPATDILGTLISHTKQKKIFEGVVMHEPRSAPRATGRPFVAFFVGAPQGAPGGFKVIKRLSGLAVAAMRLDVIARVYLDAKTPCRGPAGEPPSLDNIDNLLLAGVEAILTDCHQSISLGLGDGLWTDANGADSDGLGVDIGYLDQDQRKFRIGEIYIPVVITDYFPQAQ